ncbi:MAG: gluconolactonase [Oscillospiraceae bacterium]|nr:gluconolactonase [Oscillospiraceae bacterium]
MPLKRVCAALLLTAALIAGAAPAAGAGLVPYDTYNYDYWDFIVFTPAAYVPGRSVSGVDLGIGAFQNFQGMCVADDGAVYIADTGNNRIVILEPDLLSVRDVVDSFSWPDGSADGFARPHGVAAADGLMYVADTDNRRVVVLDGRAAVRVIRNPSSELLDANFDFVPLKVAVDYAGRVFVIARNMFQGIMTFDADDNFIGFYGTINVKITLWQRFWRVFSTKEERARQQLFIPTEFTGLDVDPWGFVYASNMDSEGVQAVRRLNPSGEDVIRTGENQNLGGDIELFAASASVYSGPSKIIDVAYRGQGIYSLLDSQRGRIFTYDHEGNLLYIFGGMGHQAGTFRQPTAIGAQENRILALDAFRNEIITFEETRYGALINQAVALRYGGDEALAVEAWREVLLLNENLELANAGIGKAYLTAGDNRTAMRYLKLGMDKSHYAIAFKRYRNEVLKENIGWMLTLLLAAVVAYAGWRSYRRRKRGRAPAGGLL